MPGSASAGITGTTGTTGIASTRGTTGTRGAGGLRRRAWLAGLLLPAGCAVNDDRDHLGAQIPATGPLPRPVRTAWVFSSGGPRGFVHVGVVKALDELQLQPDLIVGASAGALVAVLRAAGMRAAAMEALALDLPVLRLMRLSLGGTQRLSGDGVADFVRDELHQLGREPLLDKLPVMVACVSQRLADGAAVAFTRGDAGLAVQASAAIEGQFTPVRIQGQRYADADLAQPLPVRLARALGAQRVLAVDASAHEDRAPPAAASYRAADQRKRALTQPDAQLADVLLHPEFGYWASTSREYRLRCIAAGYRDTLAAASRIKALHAA